jgi:hypothetical protein
VTQTQGDGGGGGGYGGTGNPGGLCAPSNADLALADQSILVRLAVLEQLVSQILGVDVTTIDLSDISQSLGHITSGTLGGGLLGSVLAQLPKSNIWAEAGGGQKLFTNGDTEYIGLNPNTSLHAHEFLCSDFFYNFETQTDVLSTQQNTYQPPNMPRGGFDFSLRAAISGVLVNVYFTGGALPKGRFFIGMANNMLGQPGTPNPGQSIFAFGANNALSDSDVMTGIYMGFQLSQPRGDSSWKFVISNWTPGSPSPDHIVQQIYDTGFPAVCNEILEFKIHAEPDAATLEWQIISQLSGNMASGSVPKPSIQIWSGISGPTIGPWNFKAGCAVWNSSASPNASGIPYIRFNYGWAQSLHIDNFTDGSGLAP